MRLWNQIVQDENTCEEEFIGALPSDLADDILSQFAFAKLRLAAAEQLNGGQSDIIGSFNQDELLLVANYDRYNAFDIRTPGELAKKIHLDQDLYLLALEFQKEYSRLDAILDSPQIRKHLKIYLKKKYKERINNVTQGVQAFVGEYGPVNMAKQIEKSVLEIVKKTESERARAYQDMQQNIQGLTSRLESLPEIDTEAEKLTNRLGQLQSQLSVTSGPHELESFEPEKERLVRAYSDFEKELLDRVATLKAKQIEFEARETELEKAKQDYQKQMQEEKQRVVENELKEIGILKSQLSSQERAVQDEKEALENRKLEVIEKLRQITETAQGHFVRYHLQRGRPQMRTRFYGPL